MSQIKLKDRVESYQESTNYKLLNKVPVIIAVNGRGFFKTTSLLDKPFCPKFAECMLATGLNLCMNIEGSIFGYQYNDEIVIVTRNDQHLDTNPWFDNKLQKICSSTASLATNHFYKYASQIDLNIMENASFTCEVFPVPNISEAINTVIYKQQQNFHIAIQFACFYELLKKYDKNTIKEMLSGLSMDEKISLLYQETNINFNDYPLPFRRGSACYKAPKVIHDITKNKWIINTELPIFTKEQSFLTNLFKNGVDLFRDSGV